MSMLYAVTIRCPACGATHSQSLFRSLWIEDPANRALVFENRVNLAMCPHCNITSTVNASLLCTNVPRNFAVWYEPSPDAQVDKDIEDYAIAMGRDCFYVTAPRLSDWNEFKRTIEKFERGELTGKPFQFSQAAIRSALGKSARPERSPSFLGRIWKGLKG